MSLDRAVICIIFPPFGVLDKGLGAVVLVTLLTAAGWLPGIVAALVFAHSGSGTVSRVLGPADSVLVACPKGHVTHAFYRRCPMCGKRLPRL